MGDRTRQIEDCRDNDLIVMHGPVQIVRKDPVGGGKYHLLLSVTLSGSASFFFDDEGHQSHHYMEFPSDCEGCSDEECERSGDLFNLRPSSSAEGNIIDHRWARRMDPIGGKDE